MCCMAVVVRQLESATSAMRRGLAFEIDADSCLVSAGIVQRR